MMAMDIQDPPPVPPDRADDHEPTWAEMNDRLRALQDRYAKARIGSEPRSFATRFRD
jgi:hypothetical protein